MNEASSRTNVRIAYLIPEFPGQTHIFFWREIQAVRALGAEVVIHSTRYPSVRDRARHAFADGASAETRYLWAGKIFPLLGAAAWAVVRHPLRMVAFITALLTGSASSLADRMRSIRVVAPAALLAYRCCRDGVTSLQVHSAADSALIAVGVRYLTGIPFVLTIHGDLGYWRGGLRLKFETASRILFITETIRSDALANVPALQCEKTGICRMGVDSRRWIRRKSDSDRALGHRVGCVARLHPSKGIDDLIRAIGLVRAEGHRIECHIVGAGPEREVLERLAIELGVQHCVKFEGSLAEDDIIKLPDSCVVFALPSHCEPLGVVYMEAMSLGLPVIGTNSGGVPELIRDGVDGILVPPKDPKALAGAIRDILLNPDRGKALGRSARSRIEQEFDCRFGAVVVASAAKAIGEL